LQQSPLSIAPRIISTAAALILQVSPQYGFQALVPPCQKHHIVGIDLCAAGMFGEGFKISRDRF
jgi:hypothetical protein